jgi:hypothetical protein
MKRDAPPEEVEALADEEELLLPAEERLARARDVLVGRVLGEHGEGHACVLAEVVLHADKVEGGRDEDDSVRAAHGALERRGEELGYRLSTYILM